MTNARRLTNILEQQVQESDTNQFEVGEQIERNYRYYTLQPLGTEQRGRSHYLSPDVLDYVESVKALFSETFLSNRQTVNFTSSGMGPPQEADAKTAYANLMLDKNKKERMFSDFWHDAFLAKRGVVLAEWTADTAEEVVQIQGAQQQQIMQIAAQSGDVQDMDTSQLQMSQVPTPMGPQTVLSGPLVLQKDDSYVRLTLIQPEKYYRDPKVSDVADGMWATAEFETPRGTMIMDGYDPDQVESLKSDYRFRTDEVDFARKAHDQSHTRGRQVDRIESQEEVTVYKTWTWIDMSEHGDDIETDRDEDTPQFEEGLKLYEIHWACGEILRWADGSLAVREAEEMPFFEWSELRISHSEYGMCGADVVAHTQKTQTSLKRGVIDNMQMRNTTRYEAVQDNINNPRDLLDNAIGGVVWTDQIGSVAPLATPELSPMTMHAIEMLKQDNDSRSGMSALSKGMNTDAIRYQNSADMVERLSGAGKSRPMASARDWAQTFLIPLCQHICTLGKRNDTRTRVMEVRGKQIQINPQSWADDSLGMEVAVALTPQEGADHAQKLLTMHSIMLQDPEMQLLYGQEQRHALFDAVFDAMGVADSTPFLAVPGSPEVVQKQQQMAQQAQAEQQKQEQMAQFQVQAMDNEQARKWAELNNKIMDTAADNTREDQKFEWEQFTDMHEIEIERTQQRKASIG